MDGGRNNIDVIRAQPRWVCADFKLLHYEEAHALQLGLVSARSTGIVSSDILLLMEYAPVLTLGAGAGGRTSWFPSLS